MFTNKHVIIAMLVTPVLALIAWFGVGELKGEKPHAAASGQSYPLVEMSNCRYDSGQCGLENQDFKLQMTLREGAAGAVLAMNSQYELDGVGVSVGPADNELPPRAMQITGNEGTRWVLRLDQMPGPDDRIRLIASRQGSTWFGEATTRFTLGNDKSGALTR